MHQAPSEYEEEYEEEYKEEYKEEHEEEYEETLLKQEIMGLLSLKKEFKKNFTDDQWSRINYDNAVKQTNTKQKQDLNETQNETQKKLIQTLILTYLDPEKLTASLSSNSLNDSNIFLETFFRQLSLTLKLWTIQRDDSSPDDHQHNIDMILRIIWRLNRCQPLIQQIMENLSRKQNKNNKHCTIPTCLYDSNRDNKKLLYLIINAILLPCLIQQYKDVPTANLPLKIYDEMCKPLLDASNSIKRILGVWLCLTRYFKIAEKGGITHISKTEFRGMSNITEASDRDNNTNTVRHPPEGTNNNYAFRNTFLLPFRLLILLPALLHWLDNRVQARIRFLKRNFSGFKDHQKEKNEHGKRKDKRKFEATILSELKKAKKQKTEHKKEEIKKEMKEEIKEEIKEELNSAQKADHLRGPSEEGSIEKSF